MKKSNIFYKHKSEYGFWFRIFGYGLSFVDYNKYGLTFSQRLNKTKYLKIGKWIITYLPKN